MKRPARSSRLNCWGNSISTSDSSSTTRIRELREDCYESGRTVMNKRKFLKQAGAASIAVGLGPCQQVESGASTSRRCEGFDRVPLGHRKYRKDGSRSCRGCQRYLGHKRCSKKGGRSDRRRAVGLRRAH